MRTVLRQRLILAAICALVVACSESDGTSLTPPPPSPPTLGDGDWFLRTANGDTLPAKVSERFIGAAVEETFLDSARIRVNLSSASWQQQYWYRVLVFGSLDRSEVVVDSGVYQVATGASYFFTSAFRVRTMVVSPSTTQLTTTEPILFFVGASPVTGDYRRTRP